MDLRNDVIEALDEKIGLYRHIMKEYVALMKELAQDSSWIQVHGVPWHLPTKIEKVSDLLDNIPE